MSATRADGRAPETIGAQLERVRLERRAAQLELVVRRLRDRARAGDACVVERTGPGRALTEFASELEQIRRRLDDRRQLSSRRDQARGIT